MAKFTRGFAGRGRAERDARLPPGQYDTGNTWPVLTAEVTPQLDLATWTFTIEGLVERPTTWTWDEIHALPPSTLRGRHPLRHHVVEVRRALHRRLGRHAARRGRRAAERDARARVLAHRVHDEPSARRRHRRQGVGRVGVRGQAARTRSTAGRRGCSFRTSTSGRARSSSPGCACSTTTSPASGSRTATTTAATRGSSSGTRATEWTRRRRATHRSPWQTATVVDIKPETPRAKTFRLALPDADAAPRRVSTTCCASPRPTATPRRARTRSRPRPTARPSSSSPSNGSTAARSRRSCTTRSRSATSSRCAGRSAAGSCGTATRPRCSSAAVRVSCRSWRCCASHAGSGAPISCGSSCRCARPTTSTTRTRSPGRRRRSSTRVRCRRGSRVRPGGWCAADLPRSMPVRRAYVCGSSGFADAASTRCCSTRGRGRADTGGAVRAFGVGQGQGCFYDGVALLASAVAVAGRSVHG